MLVAQHEFMQSNIAWEIRNKYDNENNLPRKRNNNSISMNYCDRTGKGIME